MAIELTPNVKVRRDAAGTIRQLQHLDQPYRPASTAMTAAFAEAPTPRALAEAYLHDAASLFGLTSGETANLAAAASAAPTDAPVELRFKEEKATGAAVTVAYDQTALGLPIWDAGVTVRIDAGQMHVTGSHNAAHYNIDVRHPDPAAPYLPHAMAKEAVATLLGLPSDAPITVNATRTLIFRYAPDDRFDDQVEAHEQASEMTGLAGIETPPVPTLPVPPVPSNIESDRHYVVTEILFNYAVEPWGPLNWRAFVEPETGAVLYLRALVACARGAVFLTDPVTSSGTAHSAADPITVLDPLRTTVPLAGLTAAGGAGANQRLEGEYVRLIDLEPPGTNLPGEPDPFDFLYSCDTENFAACNAYHHCDAFFRLLDGMGIDVQSYFNNTDFPVPVDPHAFNGQVNAAAPGNIAGNGLGRLVFGLARAASTFGIAADVRVVIHEFGHAVLWDHVDSPNFGWAHSPGDSLAVILHDPESKAPDRFETFPFMNASAGLSRRHDRDPAAGWAWGGQFDNRQYGSEQILSTTLFRVYRAVGGDSADLATRQFASRYVAYLILKAVGLLNFTTRDPDVFVSALTEADATTAIFEGHPGGAFAKIFRWSFEQQGLYQPPGSPRPVSRPGAPPEIDVYIDDGRNGAYMPYSDDFAGTADIWNRHAPDAAADDQAPALGGANFAYVRVKNRGTSPASGIVVRGFKAKIPEPRTWPTDWRPLATASLAVPTPLAPGASINVGPFQWTPQYADEHLLFEVSAPGDRSTIERVTAGPILNARLVPLDNNLAQRSF